MLNHLITQEIAQEKHRLVIKDRHFSYTSFTVSPDLVHKTMSKHMKYLTSIRIVYLEIIHKEVLCITDKNTRVNCSQAIGAGMI